MRKTGWQGNDGELMWDGRNGYSHWSSRGAGCDTTLDCLAESNPGNPMLPSSSTYIELVGAAIAAMVCDAGEERLVLLSEEVWEEYVDNRHPR